MKILGHHQKGTKINSKQNLRSCGDLSGQAQEGLEGQIGLHGPDQLDLSALQFWPRIDFWTFLMVSKSFQVD